MGAAYNGETEIVRALVDAGANVDARNKEGTTPLMHTAQSCQIESMEILLEANARVDVRNNDGETAYEIARSECDYRKVQRMEAMGLR